MGVGTEGGFLGCRYESVSGCLCLGCRCGGCTTMGVNVRGVRGMGGGQKGAVLGAARRGKDTGVFAREDKVEALVWGRKK